MSFISDLGDTIEGLGETASKVADSYEKYRERRDASDTPTNPRYTQEQLEYEILRRQQEKGTAPSGPDVAGIGFGGDMDSGSMLALAGVGLLGLALFVS